MFAEAEIDGRADLYALGAVAYELLTGQAPFADLTGRRLLAAHATGLPEAVQRLRPDVPQELATLVMGCLANEPGDRPQTASEVIAALERTPITGGGARLVAVQATAAPPSVAVLPFVNVGPGREHEYFSDGMTEELIGALATISGLRVVARTSSFAFKGTNADVRDVGRKLGVQFVVEGSVRMAGSTIRVTAQRVAVSDGYRVWSERYERRLEDVFAVQDELAAAIVRELRPQLGGTDPTLSALVPPLTERLDAYTSSCAAGASRTGGPLTACAPASTTWSKPSRPTRTSPSRTQLSRSCTRCSASTSAGPCHRAMRCRAPRRRRSALCL